MLVFSLGDKAKPQHLIDGHEPSATDRVGINPAYLGALAKMPRAKNAPVVFSLNGGKPTICRWTHEEVEFTHLIMPVRLP